VVDVQTTKIYSSLSVLAVRRMTEDESFTTVDKGTPLESAEGRKPVPIARRGAGIRSKKSHSIIRSQKFDCSNNI